MALVTFDTFFPEVIPSVMGCPELVAFNAVRNTVIDFCNHTWFWQHTCFPQPGQAGVPDYEPDLPVNTKMVGIIDAWYDGKNLHPKSEPEIRDILWRQMPLDVQGEPNWYYSASMNEIILVPTPQVDSQFAGLEMIVACAPLRNSTTCVDTIYERFAEIIAQGAVGRLKGQVGQPWADPQAALLLDRLYQYGRANVKALVQRNKTRGAMMIRFNGSEY